MSQEKIVIGSDHAGYELKLPIIDYVKSLGYEVDDVGTYNPERTDYTIYGKKVGEAVASGKYQRGIAICGTGIGIGIAANKVHGIRCCSCSEPYSAKLSRQHNNSNILSFGSRVVGSELAKMIVKEWLETKYQGGRHQRRLDEISAEEQQDEQLFEAIVNSTDSKYEDEETRKSKK